MSKSSQHLNKQLGDYRGVQVYVYPTDPNRDSLDIIAIDPNERPADFRYSNYSGSYSKSVSPADLNSWYKVEYFFTWREKEFGVNQFDADRVSGSLLRGDDKWAVENGLTVLERGAAAGWFALDEVENLREERHDFLSEWKERRSR